MKFSIHYFHTKTKKATDFQICTSVPLIHIVKSILSKVLGTSRLNYEELSTIITEVEGVMNTRSLTYLYDDDVITGIT